MTSRDEITATLRAIRADIEARHPIRLVGIFGSVARGEATAESDVDILAEFRPGLSLYRLGSVMIELEEKLGRPVDIIFEEGLKDWVRSSVLADLQQL